MRDGAMNQRIEDFLGDTPVLDVARLEFMQRIHCELLRDHVIDGF
jgi:hypothetical protein